MKVFDICFEEDICFEKGDFCVIESTAQHIRHAILAQKGEYKFAPIFGGEIKLGLSEDGSLLELQGNLQDTLEQDGLHVKRLKIDKTIDIEAEYKQL